MTIILYSDLSTSLTININGVHGDKMTESIKVVFAWRKRSKVKTVTKYIRVGEYKS